MKWQNALAKKIMVQKGLTIAQLMQKVKNWNAQFDNVFSYETALIEVSRELDIDTVEFAEDILNDYFEEKDN